MLSVSMLPGFRALIQLLKAGHAGRRSGTEKAVQIQSLELAQQFTELYQQFPQLLLGCCFSSGEALGLLRIARHSLIPALS